MKKILLTTLLTLFVLSAQAGFESDYKSALKAAKSEQKKAKKLGFEWNTIGGKKGLLVKAAKLHKKGDTKGALKLLEDAKQHGILGQKQAEDQANAGPQHF